MGVGIIPSSNEMAKRLKKWAQEKSEAPVAAKVPNTNPYHIGMEIRASKTFGMAIHNPGGKNVGKASDLGLDAEPRIGLEVHQDNSRFFN